MVEHINKTTKRRLSVVESDPLWSDADLAEMVKKKLENTKLIPNKETITPFEAHFCRKQNTELSIIITKPPTSNLSYKQIRSFALDKQTLKKPAFRREFMSNYQEDFKPQLDIQYKEKPQEVSPGMSQQLDSEDSENAPCFGQKRASGETSPIKLTTSKLETTFVDKTQTVKFDKKNVARKTIARRASEPKSTLKPLWNIITDRKTTKNSPHTITLDTPVRKKNFVECKTVEDCKRNAKKSFI